MQWKAVLGLSAMVVVYLVFGGICFHFLESEHEEETKQGSGEFMQRILDEKQCLTAEELQELIKFTIEVYESGVQPLNTTTSTSWDIFSSVFFSATVITTIGYGNISPSTSGGRIFFVFYAFFGIPLCLILLSGWGDKLTTATIKLNNRLNKNRCPQKPAVGKTLRTAITILLGLFLFFFVPSIIFTLLENWSYAEALYYAFVTLTTIGFGDFVPAQSDDHQARWLYKISIGVWIFIGLAWLATVISQLQDLFENFLEKASTATDRKDQKVDNEKNGFTGSEQGLNDAEGAPQNNQEKSSDSKQNLNEMESVDL